MEIKIPEVGESVEETLTAKNLPDEVEGTGKGGESHWMICLPVSRNARNSPLHHDLSGRFFHQCWK